MGTSGRGMGTSVMGMGTSGMGVGTSSRGMETSGRGMGRGRERGGDTEHALLPCPSPCSGQKLHSLTSGHHKAEHGHLLLQAGD